MYVCIYICVYIYTLYIRIYIYLYTLYIHTIIHIFKDIFQVCKPERLLIDQEDWPPLSAPPGHFEPVRAPICMEFEAGHFQKLGRRPGFQWIGLGETLQESSIFYGTIYGFLKPIHWWLPRFLHMFTSFFVPELIIFNPKNLCAESASESNSGNEWIKLQRFHFHWFCSTRKPMV